MLRNICAVAWLMCVIVSARFLGTAKPSVEIHWEPILSVGVFPFFFGVVTILQKRMAGTKRLDWVPVLFRSVPKMFTLFYRVYFFGAWCMCAYPMIRNVAGRPEWPTFGISNQIGFLLIPSIFYLTCVGGYWSAAIESKNTR